MELYLDILERKQPKPEEIIDKEKLRYIAPQITIWDFYGIS